MWFFPFDGEDEEDGLFSEFFNLGDIFSNIFSSVFDAGGEDDYAEISAAPNAFSEKVKLVIGDDHEQINPASDRYAAHKLRLVFELEDDLLLPTITEYERLLKKNERREFCDEHNLCPACYERIDECTCKKDGE